MSSNIFKIHWTEIETQAQLGPNDGARLYLLLVHMYAYTQVNVAAYNLQEMRL
jgi:hypothetical protein